MISSDLNMIAVGQQTTVLPGLPGPQTKAARCSEQGRAELELSHRCFATDSNNVEVLANQLSLMKSSHTKKDDIWLLHDATIKPHNL